MRAAPFKRLANFRVMDGMALDELVEGINRRSATNLTQGGTLSSPWVCYCLRARRDHRGFRASPELDPSNSSWANIRNTLEVQV